MVEKDLEEMSDKELLRYYRQFDSKESSENSMQMGLKIL